MRNPVRLKNLKLRFLPAALVGGLALAFFEVQPLAVALGSGLILAGLVLRSWGAGHLVKRDQLTTSGPYAHMRHPLYTGTLLVGVGSVVAYGGWWTAAIGAVLLAWFFAAYFPRKERSESARLEALHGGDYVHYRARVPSLWPTLRPWQPARPGFDSAVGWRSEHYLDNNELGTVLAVAAGAALFALRALILS